MTTITREIINKEIQIIQELFDQGFVFKRKYDKRDMNFDDKEIKLREVKKSYILRKYFNVRVLNKYTTAIKFIYISKLTKKEHEFADYKNLRLKNMIEKIFE